MIEIYADVVFIINFVMDVLIFWIVSKLTKKKVLFKSILLGCLISTLLFCLVIFVPVLRSSYNMVTMIFVLMLGIVIAFKPSNFNELIKLFVLANVASFCVGGMGMALFYFTNIRNLIGNMVGFYVEDFSFKILLVISATAYVLIKLFIGWYKKAIIKKQKFYNIEIYFEQLKAEVNTLLDTGNSLKDPITKIPVIIIEFESIKNLLPPSVRLVFYENKENDLSYIIENIPQTFNKRIRMIPYESLGNLNGMLIGFRPDLLSINDSETSIKTDNVIVGIYNSKLSKTNEYNGLLNPVIFE